MIIRDSVLQGALAGSLTAAEHFVSGFFEIQFGVGADDEHADEPADDHGHEEDGNALFIRH